MPKTKTIAKATKKKVTNLPAKRLVTKRRKIKRKTKKGTLLALFASLFFGALAFIAWKKRANKMAIFCGLFSLLNAGFFVFNVDVLEPFIKLFPAASLLFSCLGITLYSVLNLAYPKGAKKIAKLLKL